MTPDSKRMLFVVSGALLASALLAYAGYRVWELWSVKVSLEERVAGLEQSLAITEDALSSVQDDLARAKKENADLREALSIEQGRNQSLAAQIGDISGTVGLLQKQIQTDPELLKKYSKAYFLSENYIPAQLTGVDPKYWEDKNKAQLIHPGARPHLETMLASAEKDGISLRVVSAFRSFYEQAAVKSGYTVLYGTGANQFSADQGYSEHQLGTTCDFTTPEIGDAFSAFEKSSAYAWLTGNAYKFGFILSYPKNNLYYQFEPWHWRFVGVKLATALHSQNKYFYELTQRELDEYLVSIFD